MRVSRLISLGAFAAWLAMPGAASAATITQSAGPLVSAGGDTYNLVFNGFNAGLGTLTGVTVQLTISDTVTDFAFNVTGSNQPVGAPTPLTATSTTTITGPSSLSLSNVLSTPGFAGSLAPGFSTVGTASISGLVISSNPTPISNYIGGPNTITLVLTDPSSLSGSVPSTPPPSFPLVFLSDTVSETILVDLIYTYTPSLQLAPEPASLALLLTGLAGFGVMRRRRG